MAWDEIAEFENLTVSDLLAMNPESKNRFDMRERIHAYEVYISKLRSDPLPVASSTEEHLLSSQQAPLCTSHVARRPPAPRSYHSDMRPLTASAGRAFASSTTRNRRSLPWSTSGISSLPSTHS